MWIPSSSLHIINMEWLYLNEEPLNYQLGGPNQYMPQQDHLGPPPPNYNILPQPQDPYLPYQGPPPPYPSYGHNQEMAFHNGAAPYHTYGPQYPDVVPLPDRPYQYKESDWEEEEEDEDEEEDEEDDEEEDFAPPNTLEEALQEVNIQLPRLSIAAPPSVQPPKGGGRCRLPNLGNSCYMNAVLQCLYHTPTFPAALALVCEGLEDGKKRGRTVARALTFLMTKMDDITLMKRGMMAYFKGVCGLRDESFAGMEQQEAHNLLSGLLLWLHQDLASAEELDCACTKYSLAKQPITKHHHQQGSHQSHPPVNNRTKSGPQDNRKPGKVCKKCGVTYQRRSLISDVFEGIHQSDIICARVGIILHTTYERFTSLSVSVSSPQETTLEEALQQYYGVNMINWDCEYCDKNHLCHQQIRVLYAPRFLLIHLSRHTNRHNPRKQSVIFPVEHLTLEDHMAPSKKDKSQHNKYSLYAVCNHHGTMMQGHYNACCRANKSQTQHGYWFTFDDDEVSRMTEFSNAKEAHILFYTNTPLETT